MKELFFRQKYKNLNLYENIIEYNYSEYKVLHYRNFNTGSFDLCFIKKEG